MKVYDIDSLPLMKVCKDENGKYFVTGGVTYNYKPKIKEKNKKYNTKQNPKIYRVLMGMKRRCYNINHQAYKRYGLRGIKIYEEWLNNYQSFIQWALYNGYKEGLEIDRIDNDGNYEPNNCRWVTRKENMKNTRRSIYNRNKLK